MNVTFTGCAEKRIQPLRGRTTRNLGEKKVFFTAFVLPPLQETEISLHMMVQFMELKNLLWRMRKLMYFGAHEKETFNTNPVNHSQRTLIVIHLIQIYGHHHQSRVASDTRNLSVITLIIIPSARCFKHFTKLNSCSLLFNKLISEQNKLFHNDNRSRSSKAETDFHDFLAHEKSINYCNWILFYCLLKMATDPINIMIKALIMAWNILGTWIWVGNIFIAKKNRCWCLPVLWYLRL